MSESGHTHQNLSQAEGTCVNKKSRRELQVLHVDIIGDKFWQDRPDILGGSTTLSSE